VARSYVDLVRDGYRAWNDGDVQWVLDHMAPEVEWVAAAENPDPDTYFGLDQIERLWGEWREAVGQLHFEAEELIDKGDSVVAVTRRIGRGTHSGVEVSDHIVQIFAFGEDGKCVRVREFFDKSSALRAVSQG
jgi:ketosteroid isomerase-like protein